MKQNTPTHRNEQGRRAVAGWPHANPLVEVLATMAAHGVAPARGLDALKSDGRLHRYRVEGDRPGTTNGWAVIHLDAPPSAAFGSWRAGVSGTWSATTPEALSPAERELLHHRAVEARRQRDTEQRRRWEDAAQQAAATWRQAPAADPGHGYLIRKQIPAGIARQDGEALLLPLADMTGKVWSLQRIWPDGRKRFMPGGRTKAAFLPIHGRRGADLVLIAEGFATGMSLAMAAPQALVLASGSAGNMPAVAQAARERHPFADLVVCADLGPVGECFAEQAARAVGGRVATPAFPPGVAGSDFNDMANHLAGGAA